MKINTTKGNKVRKREVRRDPGFLFVSILAIWLQNENICRNLQINLYISKKSCTFAPYSTQKKRNMDYKLTEDGLYAYEYPRASVTADAVLFAEKEGQMYVLLIQRGNDPYKGYWAFPGGFLNMDETVARCAERELEEETGIVLTGMQLSGIYSDVERDPRGRVITAAYTAMTTMPEATAADDAAAAQWWPLNELPPLAFDHDKILADAKKVLKID